MAALDNIIHQPVRLQIMASLISLDLNEQVEFTYLRKLLRVTDGNLGAHLAKLEEAGYVKIDKTFVDRKPRTYVSATGKGRDAFAGHVAALNEILRGANDPTQPVAKSQ
ncbi:MAG: transcriptional regulator [Sedimentisphaerales bacterium]|nr:transcriptional regulator [Sedimentisphaerales bacterium]